jgi:hypothetical protein
MKTYGGVDVYIHLFLTPELVGAKWSASRPWRFTPGARAPGTHWIGDCVGPRAGLDDTEKIKFLTLPGLELGSLNRPAHSHALTWILKLHYVRNKPVCDSVLNTIYGGVITLFRLTYRILHRPTRPIRSRDSQVSWEHH